MSTLAATNLKHASSASNNIVLDSSGNTTISGNAVVTGTLQANGVTGSVYPLVSGTAQASTSGTSIDFTGIPSWVKRVTVVFNGVSTNGTSFINLQIGTSSGVETSGYLSQANTFDSGPGGSFATSGFSLTELSAAAYNWTGVIPICLVGANLWVTSGVISTASGSPAVTIFGGTKTLAGTLDRVRITTGNGTDTFDAGSINILYE